MKLLYASLCYPPSLGGGEAYLHALARHFAGTGDSARAVTQWTRLRRDWLLGSTLRCAPDADYVQDGIKVGRIGFDRWTRARMLPWVLACRFLPGTRPTLRALPIARLAACMRGPFERAVERSARTDGAFDPGGATGATDAASSAPEFDLVHGIRIGVEFPTRAALDYARRLDIPFVITALHHPHYVGPAHEPFARLYRAADAVIGFSEFERRALIEQKGVDPSRVHVTGLGPLHSDLEDESGAVTEFRERYRLDGPYVLFVARKVEHKGWRALLGAAPRVHERFPDVEFVFVGADRRDSIEAFARNRDPRIRNLGPVDERTKTAAFAGCTMFCMPSIAESFGIVYLEAWSFGKPVIAGRIPALEEIVDEGRDGLLVQPTPDEVADAILALLEDPSAAARMGAAGRAKQRERYHWDAVGEATRAIYRRAVDGAAVGDPAGSLPSFTRWTRRARRS